MFFRIHVWLSNNVIRARVEQIHKSLPRLCSDYFDTLLLELLTYYNYLMLLFVYHNTMRVDHHPPPPSSASRITSVRTHEI